MSRDFPRVKLKQRLSKEVIPVKCIEICSATENMRNNVVFIDQSGQSKRISKWLCGNYECSEYYIILFDKLTSFLKENSVNMDYYMTLLLMHLLLSYLFIIIF